MKNIFDLIPDPVQTPEEPEPEDRVPLTKSNVKRICQEIINSKVYRNSLDVRIQYGTLPPAVECRLWDYAYGKPADTLEVKHPPSRLTDVPTEEIEKRLREMADYASRLKQVEDTIAEATIRDESPEPQEPSVH